MQMRRFSFVVVVLLILGLSACSKSPTSPTTTVTSPSLSSNPVVSVTSVDPQAGTAVVSYNLTVRGFPPRSIVGVYPCWGQTPNSIEGPCNIVSARTVDDGGGAQFDLRSSMIPVPPGTHRFFVLVVVGNLVIPPPIPPPIEAVPDGSVVYAVSTN